MKRGAAEGLRKATRYFRQRRYGMVINFLEPQVFLYRDNARYYYLLGMSCVHTGDFAGASSYLQRALDIEPDANAGLGLAAVLLRRRHIDSALRSYLDVLEIDPNNRRAKRALGWLRGVEDPEEPLEWFEERRIRRILPAMGIYIPLPIRALLILLVVAGVALAAVRFAPELRSLLPSATTPREGADLLDLDSAIARTGGEARLQRYELTPNEIDDAFARIERDFLAGNDNQVRIGINRIKLSNASAAVRERALLIEDYLEAPDFTTFPDRGPTYDEVLGEPLLYEGVYVRWQGRTANVVVGDDAIRFDLLVGYVERTVLDGIVPTAIPFAVVARNDLAVEVVGRLRTSPNGIVGIEVVSFRQLPADQQD